MIWIVLVAIGVPLWLCALAIGTLVLRNRTLRARPGDVAVRVRAPGGKRWRRAHAVWVSDVLAWRGSPAAWADDLVHVGAVSIRPVRAEDGRSPNRLGDGALLVQLESVDGPVYEMACRREGAADLLGPFAARAEGV
jgi:hypothetical protein